MIEDSGYLTLTSRACETFKFEFIDMESMSDLVE